MVEAFAEQRRETNARFDALTDTLAEYRRETNNALAEYRQYADARMSRAESNTTRLYLALIGLMGALIVAGIGGAIAILLNGG